MLLHTEMNPLYVYSVITNYCSVLRYGFLLREGGAGLLELKCSLSFGFLSISFSTSYNLFLISFINFFMFVISDDVMIWLIS